MPGQCSFSDLEYANRRRITKRESFLKMMDEIIPWSEWTDLIRPFCPKGDRGRPPRGIEVMLRMYLVQSWFNLSVNFDATRKTYMLLFFNQRFPENF